MDSQLTVFEKTQKKKVSAGLRDACLCPALVRAAVAATEHHVQKQGGEERVDVAFFQWSVQRPRIRGQCKGLGSVVNAKA